MELFQLRRSMPAPRFIAACVTLAMLAGCATVVAPPSRIGTETQLQAAQGHTSQAAAEAGIKVGVPLVDWWRQLQDPVLNDLVARAMQHNHDLNAAMSAVGAARGMADAAHREALPRGSLSTQAQHTRLSTAEADPYHQGGRPPANKVFAIDQSLNWEIDLFGRIGTAAAIADRRVDVARAEMQAVAVLLQGAVVTTYTRWRHAQQDLRALEQTVVLNKHRATLLQERAIAGLTDQRAAFVALQELTEATGECSQVRAQAKTYAAALEVLTGRSPLARAPDQPGLSTALPNLPTDAVIVYPDDMLARRPDIVKADALLRAAIGGAALAERAHLPRLSLNLSAGLFAPFGQLGNAGAVRHAAGPALSWDWLNAGQLAARAAAAGHEQRASWHQFEQAVLKALEEGEASLRQWTAASRGLEAARNGEQAAQNLMRYSEARTKAGLEPNTQALEHAIAYQRAQRTTLAAQAQALQAYTRVQMALGAWQTSKDDVAAR